MVCRNCNYEWKPRKDNPKQCPNCKVYLEVTVKEVDVNRYYNAYKKFYNVAMFEGDFPSFVLNEIKNMIEEEPDINHIKQRLKAFYDILYESELIASKKEV